MSSLKNFFERLQINWNILNQMRRLDFFKKSEFRLLKKINSFLKPFYL